MSSRTYIATRLSDGSYIVDIFAHGQDLCIGHLKFPAHDCKTLSEAEELARRVDMLNDLAKQERLKTQGRLF
jgi:hypothetical protein